MCLSCSYLSQVATFRKTRHENLVLFMGACMKPPRLAIVTSMCKGLTLYTHIHIRKDKFNMNRTTMVAQQISQGMGYLHARGIIHKDLKSKNIFLQNGKVVITDFGLFSVTKLCFGNRYGIYMRTLLCIIHNVIQFYVTQPWLSKIFKEREGLEHSPWLVVLFGS